MLVLMLLATPVLVFAQNTGKIAGQVTDADTGDPLPGAQVVVVGTTLGTVTDVDGNYFVIGVPVGSYDVQARFVGYQNATVSGVDISSGYTQEVNFALSAGVELDEVVVEYERPLIQKDAIGVPKIVDAEEIVNLPVRGAAEIAKTQAGVVSQEGSGTLNVRGGRGSEVSYYIDGVKVVGSAAVPQSAVQEQEMIIGNISARYGDAMSGIISITTKSGSPNFFGSFEGITSEALDDFGYNLASFAIGGPVVGENVNFFLSAEIVDQADSSPSALGELRLSDSQIDQLNSFPTSLPALDMEGNEVYIPMPASLGGSNVTLPIIYNADTGHGEVEVIDGVITASDGTTISVPENVDVETINFVPVESAALLTEDDFTVSKEKRRRASDRLAFSGNLTFNLIENVRFRLGGRYVDSGGESISTRNVVFAPDGNRTEFERKDAQFYGTWTHYLSNNTFYQLQVDFTDRTGTNWDPRFSDSRESILDWGDFDNDVYAVTRGYKDVTMQTISVDDHDVQQPVYSYRYADGRFPVSETVTRLVAPPGGTGTVSYFEFHNTQLRFNALATTQIGLHQIEFGGEFEQQTNRSWSKFPETLSRFVEDPDAPHSPGAEQLPSDETGVTSLSELTFDQLGAGYTGYNFYGSSEVDSENLNAYVNDCTSPDDANWSDDNCTEAFGDAAYNIAPYEPLFYGGYVQDKIEFRDIVLNLGLRVDVFDNNTRVLYDEWHRLPVERAGDVGLASSSVGDDWAVYYNQDTVEGYRDLDGQFYNANGEAVGAGDVLLTG
ncbi:MAG: TonB-dependent receptor plug domain-containing protein, partial [Rhodothermales bacterium]|nr:TonB-dependent receptor plug domain-containing protein [Rhodothermales bacterium]